MHALDAAGYSNLNYNKETNDKHTERPTDIVCVSDVWTDEVPMNCVKGLISSHHVTAFNWRDQISGNLKEARMVGVKHL